MTMIPLTRHFCLVVTLLLMTCLSLVYCQGVVTKNEKEMTARSRKRKRTRRIDLFSQIGNDKHPIKSSRGLKTKKNKPAKEKDYEEEIYYEEEGIYYEEAKKEKGETFQQESQSSSSTSSTLALFSSTATMLDSPFENSGVFDVCYVCGHKGRQVGDPSALLDYQLFPGFTCKSLENAGLSGSISPRHCEILKLSVLQDRNGGCQCQDSKVTAPTNYNNIDAIDSDTGNSCSICGFGYAVNRPEAMFTEFGGEGVSCGILEKAGLQGKLKWSLCQQFPTVQMWHTCSCKRSSKQYPSSY